jgi:hypothetical protein
MFHSDKRKSVHFLKPILGKQRTLSERKNNEEDKENQNIERVEEIKRRKNMEE